MTVTADDAVHLRRCIELAREALEDGDEPFGSVLVSQEGEVLFEDRNRVKDGDATRHPEFEISRWAAAHLVPDERARATVYTSGEHCPMCAASHGWVGLGRIVYVASSAQLNSWLSEWGIAGAPVAALPITDIVPSAVVDGPANELIPAIKALHRARLASRG
ncbi:MULTISPECIES: nucleoside deaminase [unclassified Microbacterium]|uniref:nucleoside deaminase n=1 Tax=unclassified Microbacterium TaxID=2609290 RepID=UPI000EA99B71|nr:MULTISPECIES: nucleoside deaminase [unclassified Microbacterium]MBT2486220.1 nucleoside deaminase [Microbacterium sp. ISL-108]RKN68940.1 nucleoside deaminase [Microbacterium sp. CGR2]